MVNCVPCGSRGRVTEAAHTVTNEPWCKWCYFGAYRPNQPLQVQQRVSSLRPQFGEKDCKNCGSKLHVRNKSGYCTPCGLLPGIRRLAYASYAKAMETQAWKKYRPSSSKAKGAWTK